MKRKITGIFAIIIAFCIAFSGLPFLAGELDSNALAASSKITLKVKAKSKHKITLKWNKVKKPNSGYAVFRNGKLVKRLGKKKTTYTDKGLAAGTTYKYQIKTYKKTKITKWYNKKTSKWQKKKPARKYRGKSKKVTKYKYKKKSNILAVKTAKAGGSAPGQSSDGVSGTNDINETDTTSSTQNKTDDVTAVGTYTVTNYLGNENVYTEMSDGTLRTKNGTVLTKDTIPPKADHTKDGTFESNEGHTMIQYHGATFDKYELEHDKDEIYLSSMEPGDYEYFVSMYNGDESKLTIEFDSNVYVQSINSYKEVGDRKYEPETRYYYFKNGHPIAMPYSNGTQFRTEKSGNLTRKFFMINTANGSIGNGIGIWVDTFNVNIKYDGKLIHTFTIDTVKDETNGANWTPVDGMSPYRKLALEIADDAISKSGGSTGSVYQDMIRIGNYIREHYPYGKDVSRYGATMRMKCFDGAIILETYSIVRYGKWGFESSGSNYDLTSGKHSAFNLNESPYDYYEAEGYR